MTELKLSINDRQALDWAKILTEKNVGILFMVGKDRTGHLELCTNDTSMNLAELKTALLQLLNTVESIEYQNKLKIIK